MTALPGCTITDTYAVLGPSGAMEGLAGTITARASAAPLFVQQQGGAWIEQANTLVSALDTQGTWTLVLPSQPTCDPPTVTWTITLPDGTAWNGPVTAAMVTASQSAPLGLHDLKATYGWVVVQGGAGTALSTFVATPAALGMVLVDQSPASGNPVALTLDSTLHVPPGRLPAATTTTLGAVQVGSGLSVSSAGLLASESPTVLAADHGVVPTASGVTNTANLNAAIASLSAAGGGIIDFPSGSFSFSGAIVLMAGVFLRGTHRTTGFSVVSGTIFNFPPGSNGISVDFSQPGCGIIGLFLTGGINHVYAPNGLIDFHMEHCGSSNPQMACLYMAGQCNFSYFSDLFLQGGQYCIYVPNPTTPAPSSGASVWACMRFANIEMTSWQVRACDFTFGIGSNNVTWLNVISHFAQPSAGQAGGIMTVRGQAPNTFTFINWNAEFVYGQQLGTAAYTVCSGASGSSTLSCAALTGNMPDGTAAWQVGQTVTIQGADTRGADWSSTISSVSGTTLTLHDPVPTTVSDQEITPYTGADFDFPFGCSGAHFIDCTFGTSAGGLYALRTTGPGPCYVRGASFNQIRPLSDPWGQVHTDNRTWLVRRSRSSSGSGIGDLPLSSSYFEAASAVQASNPPLGGNDPRRTQIAAPSGGDLRLAFTETVHDGTGSYGKLRVTRYNETDVLVLDPQAPTLQLGTGPFNSAFMVDVQGATPGVRVGGITLGYFGTGVYNAGDSARLLHLSGPAGQATQLGSPDGIGFLVGGSSTATSYLDANNVLHVGSGLAAAQATRTASSTITDADGTILVNAAGTTQTLPDATTRAGRVFIIKNDASGSSTTVATTSTQTIDGASTYALATAYAGVTVQSNGAAWRVIGTV